MSNRDVASAGTASVVAGAGAAIKIEVGKDSGTCRPAATLAVDGATTSSARAIGDALTAVAEAGNCPMSLVGDGAGEPDRGKA